MAYIITSNSKGDYNGIIMKGLDAFYIKVKEDFIWKSIICCFSLLRIIISDNGWQFSDFKLTEFYKDLGITYCLTSISHPQANRDAKVHNSTLF